ncbi:MULTISPECIES: M4 family metallopeptidase [unclassified Streptomyces]|uniref:M4 family metallopeptidase n=1 Tax=unclassified Streptomyces TaxID=2593676 RepID=UPI0022B6A10E|nr:MULTISPECIES: M4 family metallopeptidase [unclassified Streptomyces]MCZ7414103.1 M4 family metallopeptidase [Streptomyces sp. WMMC897]MCZ7431098.1 M4 family metallopeptidase [Streptomyces sp. WMMC1477]
MTFTNRKHRISALAVTAAFVAAGLTAGTAGAEPGDTNGLNKGAMPASLSASAYTDLVRAADSPAAKAKTAQEIGLGAQEGLEVKSVVKNRDGSTHTRYARTYDGLPVLGGDLIVHRDADGEKKGVTKAVSARVTVPSTRAAEEHRPATPQAEGSVAPRKVVWATDKKAVLAWETVVGGLQDDGAPSELHVITDARNGKTLAEWQGVHKSTGSGDSMYVGEVPVDTDGTSGSYTMTDTVRGGHQTQDADNGNQVFTDADNLWGDGTPQHPQTAAVDAHYGAALTWDYFKLVHGRDGIRGDGVGASSRVHYGDAYVNAFWQDSCFCMTYGDGENNEKPLTSLDVAAHEMTHGVTSHTAGLIYRGESGGINEATSDIFAAAVEFYAANPADPADYLVGEKIDIRGNGTPLRYMDQPSKDGNSLDYWSRDARRVDVHYSSGIGNHFFYLLAEGSGQKTVNGVTYDSPTYDGSTVTGIGVDKAATIWFKALTEQMTSRTDYADARDATVTAATQLYGAGSTEVAAVEAAWTAVNVK